MAEEPEEIEPEELDCFDPMGLIDTLAGAMYNISLCDFDGNRNLIDDRKLFFEDSMTIIGKCNRIILEYFKEDTK